jgi:hypothetical protein
VPNECSFHRITAKHPACVLTALAATVSLPLQDEPFHVPMAQLYCRGDLLTWDAKITTFPGLYVIGAAYAWASQLLLGWTGMGLVRRAGQGRGRAVHSLPWHAAGARSSAMRSRNAGVVLVLFVPLCTFVGSRGFRVWRRR